MRAPLRHAVPAAAPPGAPGTRERPDGDVEASRWAHAITVVLPDGECVEELYRAQEPEPARRHARHSEVA